MLETFKKPETIRRIEFCIATLVYLFFLATLFATDLEQDTFQVRFRKAGLPFDFYANYLFPGLIRYTTLYLAFLLLNFRLAPRLLQREEVGHQAFFIFLALLATGFILGTAGTYTHYYLYGTYTTNEVVYSIVFRDNYGLALLLVFLVGIYSVIKYLGLALLTNSDAIPPKYRTVTRDSLGALLVWSISILMLLVVEAERFIILAWGSMIPTGIMVYCMAFLRFIPASVGKKKPFLAYLTHIGPSLLLLFPPLFLILTILSDDPETSSGTAAFNVACQLFIMVPLAWVLFKRYARGNEEVHVLRKELGQTHANFDFLRSQINPHFLFNALNTIYGTAIQEKAERTSEGVQKLGDMMRFMLQENTLDKIPLAREVEYLTNYISLQKLRTDPSPAIRIQVEIQQTLHSVQIAPMLLIPFVENAFKHGISFREPSHVTISLEVKENILHFDVHNSKHVRQGSDPEQYHNGIGLDNVRQRLHQLYPGRHDLMVRENAREFFVHLTLHLV